MRRCKLTSLYVVAIRQRSLRDGGKAKKHLNLLHAIVNYVDRGDDILVAECRYCTHGVLCCFD